MSLSGDDTTAARGQWLKYKTLVAALEHYCTVNGVVSHEYVEQHVPLAKYFWHRDGIAGKAFPQLAIVARRWLCTQVSTARVESDVNKKKHLFPPERLQEHSPHVSRRAGNQLERLLCSYDGFAKRREAAPTASSSEIKSPFVGRGL